jgi:hypothetical protein
MTRPDDGSERLSRHARGLFEDSVAGLDAGTRARLAQARHRALDAASSRRAAWRGFAPAGAVAAAVLGIALWLGDGRAPLAPQSRDAALPDALEFVAQAEDAELLGDDLEFYAWAVASATGENG